MKKANENDHPVYCILRDWSKVHKANIHVNTVAEKTEHVPVPSLSILPTKQVEVKCARQVYFLPH